MRASLPFAASLLLAPLTVAVACSPQLTARPAAPPQAAPNPPGTTATAEEPAPSQPAPASATPANAAPAPSAVECTKDEACGGADAGPPPLTAGKGVADPFAKTGAPPAKHKAPCTKDTLKQQLSKIVDACRKSSRSICGDVVLHTAAGDAGNDNVSVDFNLGTSGDTMGFSKCVVSRINSVTWECAIRGQDVRLDLGCQL